MLQETLSVFVRFKIKGKENSYFLAWTTTPWTLPSNTALCVNPDEAYVKVKTEDSVYILAEKLCDKVAIIKGGRLIRSGTMEEVKGNESLEEVFLELGGSEA